MTRISRSLVAALVALVPISVSCSGGGDTYNIEVHFSRTVALYEESAVKVMGVTVGEVDRIELGGDEVIVTLAIDSDVPLPADATVAIEPASLIGERNVVLTRWLPGDERMAPGTVIPIERAIVPVEPDEALQAITDLVGSLDPATVSSLLSETAGALDGNGAKINRALVELSSLIPYLAAQDDELLALASDVNRISAVIRARDTEIGRLLENFSTVAGVLAEERDAIVGFVESLVSLSRQGRALLTAYEVTLPDDLATLASVAFTVQVNADAVSDLVPAILALNIEIVDAYDPLTQGIRGRGLIPRLVLEQLQPLLDALSVRPCIPIGGGQCQ